MAKITPDDNTEYFSTTLEEYKVTYSMEHPIMS